MTMNPMQIRKSAARLRGAVWSARVAFAAIAGICTHRASAQMSQPFTQGNIVVEQLGNGITSLNTSNCPIFFDEFATSGAGQTPIQSLPIPATGPNAMVEGSGGSQGGMTLSANGQFICFPGGVTNT